jgi:hypothetical protein
MPETAWQRVLKALLETEQVLRAARSQTPIGREHRDDYRNGHPLDPAVRAIRVRIAFVRGHVDNV